MQKEILDALEEVEEVVEKEVDVEKKEVDDDKIQAPKRPRTQKQIDAFKLVCEKRTLAREARLIERNEKEIEDQKILDDKIVKKAIKITKKKIKAEKILDEPAEKSDDELQQKRLIVPKKVLAKPVIQEQDIKPKIQFIFV